MSSDLWAAFGSPPDNSRQVQPSPAAGGNDTQNRERPSNQRADEEKWETDSWGAVNDAIEDAWAGSQQRDAFAQPATHATGQPASFPFAVDAGEDDFGDFEEPESAAPVMKRTPVQRDVPVPQPIAEPTAADDTDDFGDFAEVEPGDQPQHHPFPASDHGSLGNLHSRPQASVSEAQRSDASGLGSLIDFDATTPDVPGLSDSKPVPQSRTETKKTVPREVPVLLAKSDSEDNDDDWDDLGATSTKVASSVAGKGSTTRSEPPANEPKPAAKKGAISSKKASTANVPPPTNIPPPSVLISLICSLLPDLPEKIGVTIVETWDEDEADVRMHLETLQVAARIVAGRKLRWKRDTILAQSMKIGMSGRQGGMKLAGVDRAEMQREDREVSELVRIWRRNLGPIRSALAEASSSTSKKSPLPAMAETMVVRTATAENGGIQAPRYCVLCGLKRDERAEKVDTAVWDQFGEWWTEHWGHTACKAFWEGHQRHLYQR